MPVTAPQLRRAQNSRHKRRPSAVAMAIDDKSLLFLPRISLLLAVIAVAAAVAAAAASDNNNNVILMGETNPPDPKLVAERQAAIKRLNTYNQLISQPIPTTSDKLELYKRLVRGRPLTLDERRQKEQQTLKLLQKKNQNRLTKKNKLDKELAEYFENAPW